MQVEGPKRNETHAEWLERKEERIRRQKERHSDNFIPSPVEDEIDVPKLSEKEVWEIIHPKKKEKRNCKSEIPFI